ncbi:SDR family NAD(P)-dependent oxidoreductase [Longispora albida]|uniref:SDR family NAD(P)-dependent oxidoreductase n=1 Tax=Longispora albida TaxID=203523 RepID=UPI00036E19B9|nr:SDR family NAD(P)-dependent oxidoreductase [Longispora albida]
MNTPAASPRQALVTGGSRGIGYAIAAALVASGHQVTITGRNPDTLALAAKELGAVPVAFDAADPASITAALPSLPATVDVLVNNAGANTDFTAPDAEPDDLTALADAWRSNLDTNLLSAVLTTAAVEPRLAPDARVVTIGSIAARRGAGSYGAAKAAVEAWNASLSAELGPRGITTNVVAPGLTLDTEFFQGHLTSERERTMIGQTRTGRAGRPADIAAAVCFLASPEAGHVTGQVIHVNGGAHLGV